MGLRVATYEDMVQAFAEMLVVEWEAKNQEPFVNSGTFPAEMGFLLAEILRAAQPIVAADAMTCDFCGGQGLVGKLLCMKCAGYGSVRG